MTAPSGEKARSSWAGVGVLIACATLWSLNGPLIKLLHQASVPGITIASYRSLIGGLAFAPFAWRQRRTLGNVNWGWPLVTMLTFTIMTASFVIANTLTAASNAILLQYTSPIWVFLLAPLILREKAAKAEGAALLVAMTGVGIIVCGNPPKHHLGLLCALISGWGYGTLTVLLRKLAPVDAKVVTALNSVGSGVLLLPAVALWGRFEVRGMAIPLLAGLGLVQFALPYFMFSWALKRVPASRASLILLLEVVLNPIWTVLAVGEWPPRATMVGGPLILAGVAISLLISWRISAKSAAVP